MKILKALALMTVPIIWLMLVLVLNQISSLVQHADYLVRHVDFESSTSLQQLDNTISDIGSLAVKAGVAADRAGTALDFVNRPCDAKDASGKRLAWGTLCDVDQTLMTLRGTAGEVYIAAHHEDAQLNTLDAQERVLFGDAHRVLGDVSSTVSAAQPLLQASTVTVQHADATVSVLTPQLNRMLSQSADVAQHWNAISGDFEYETHKLTHPPIKKLTFWTGTEATVQFIKQFIPPFF